MYLSLHLYLAHLLHSKNAPILILLRESKKFLNTLFFNKSVYRLYAKLEIIKLAQD